MRPSQYWRGLTSDAGCGVRSRGAHRRRRSSHRRSPGGRVPLTPLPVDGRVPDPSDAPDEAAKHQWAQAIDYMDVQPGQQLEGLPIQWCFIGSCTNGRLSDLRAAAAVVDGGHVAPHVRALVVPGSAAVRRAAEAEGLDRVFTAAGFEWGEAGCGLCPGLGGVQLAPGERCVSTSNRNFMGRQGAGVRTHLAGSRDGRVRRDQRLHRRRPRGGVMEAFTVVRGPAAPLLLPDVNTDLISPAHGGRGSMSANAFAPLRYLPDGSDNPEFVSESRAFQRRTDPARRPQLRVRQLAGVGRVVAARARHPLRHRRELRRHLLRQLLPERRACRSCSEPHEIGELAREAAGGEAVEVDLQTCRITAPSGRTIAFEVNPTRRTQLLEGAGRSRPRNAPAGEQIEAFQRADRQAEAVGV